MTRLPPLTGYYPGLMAERASARNEPQVRWINGSPCLTRFTPEPMPFYVRDGDDLVMSDCTSDFLMAHPEGSA